MEGKKMPDGRKTMPGCWLTALTAFVVVPVLAGVLVFGAVLAALSWIAGRDAPLPLMLADIFGALALVFAVAAILRDIFSRVRAGLLGGLGALAWLGRWLGGLAAVGVFGVRRPRRRLLFPPKRDWRRWLRRRAPREEDPSDPWDTIEYTGPHPHIM